MQRVTMPGCAPAFPAAPSVPALFCLHGQGVRLRVEHPLVAGPAADLLSQLAEDELPFEPIDGAVCTYNGDDVLRRVDAEAVRVCPGDVAFHPLYELFRCPGGDRYWHVDERWGLTEVDLVRGRWRSHVLPEPRLDATRLFEATVWWPLSHLLAGHGLHLVPATSLAGSDGLGTLLLSPGGDDREAAAVGPPIRLIGPRWTALREESRGIDLLTMPGTALGRSSRRPLRQHTDMVYFGSGDRLTCRRASCQNVYLAESQRDDVVTSTPILGRGTIAAVKRAWPLPTIHPASQRFIQRLATTASVRRVRLARDGRRLIDHLTGDDGLIRAA